MGTRLSRGKKRVGVKIPTDLSAPGLAIHGTRSIREQSSSDRVDLEHRPVSDEFLTRVISGGSGGVSLSGREIGGQIPSNGSLHSRPVLRAESPSSSVSVFVGRAGLERRLVPDEFSTRALSGDSEGALLPVQGYWGVDFQ